jgi:hypothetical protein
MTRHWQFFSKPVIDPVQLLESGRWQGNANVFGFKVGCAAGAVIQPLVRRMPVHQPRQGDAQCERDRSNDRTPG